MTADALQHRRAAYAALLPVLGQEQALRALELLPAALPSDAVSDVIQYVDAVASRHAMDDGTRRRLYASLFATLRTPATRLPADPLGAAPAPALAAAPAHAIARAGAATPASPGHGAVRADGIVFDALVQQLIQQLQAHHGTALAAVRDACLAEFSRARVTPLTREVACAAWHLHQPHAWRIDGTRDELAELVHRLYLALCHVLGPTSADALLTHAARQAAQLPEAQECPPGRLL